MLEISFKTKDASLEEKLFVRMVIVPRINDLLAEYGPLMTYLKKDGAWRPTCMCSCLDCSFSEVCDYKLED